MANAGAPFDRDLLHDPTVLAIILLNLAGYLFAALLGYGLGAPSLDRPTRADRTLTRGASFVAWSCYAVLVGCGLLTVLRFQFGVLNASTVPRFLAAVAIYGIVIGACVLLARPRNLYPLAPLPLLLAGPFAAVSILESKSTVGFPGGWLCLPRQ